MKNNNCSDCADKTYEGRAYIDEKTNILCIDLESKSLPRGKDVLVPFVCTTCGKTTWKTISTEEAKE